MLNDTESSATFWASVQDVAIQALQLIDIRLALVIGLAAFMLAVGFDSSGNRAEAADLVTRAAPVPVRVSVQAAPSPRGYAAEGALLPSDAQLATARRLRHGTLTSAIMTNNRLTEAHFFTDLPSGQ
ncbi:MAG: hypothetical protein EA368_16135 [Leptolyngbya sp. DLM2.Bin27]|nr:MAG: hypothetical protein EA368_16135 [Leptolyngbya sp. DLM2.Bin27]